MVHRKAGIGVDVVQQPTEESALQLLAREHSFTERMAPEKDAVREGSGRHGARA